MKALIYCRVSTERQVNEGNGLSSQEQRCTQYATNKNYFVQKVFRDDGISGGLFERPKIKELITYIDDHPDEKYVVIFDDLARLARDLKVHLQLKTEFISRGVKLECPNFIFEDSPEGEFIENVLASKAQLDRQQNRRQVIQKMKARAELGYWPLCLPPGLKNVKHPIHGKVTVNDEPVASIFKSAIEGFKDRKLITQFDVVDFINTKYELHGIKKKISLHGVQLMLSKIIYAGWIEYPKWNISRRKAQFDGFISIETFDEVQSILKSRNKPKIRKDTNPEFPLRGLILCSECNKPLTASFHHGHHGQLYPHYFCKTNKCPLKDKSIKRQDLENDFISILFSKSINNEMKELIFAVLNDIWDQQMVYSIEVIKKHTQELENTNEKIRRLTERITKISDITLIQTYEGELIRLGKKKEELESIKFGVQYSKNQFGTAAKKVLNVLENPASMWQSKNLDDQLTVYFMHFEEKPVYYRGMGFGTPKLSQSVNLIHSFKSEKSVSVEMPSSELGSERISFQLLHA